MKCKKCVEQYEQLKKERDKYKALCMLDDLTNLYNHRKLHKDISKYCAIQKRHKTKFYIVMIDIDNFKKINDTLGHNKGDEILIKTGKILKRSVRTYDKVYRNYKGDEFIVIFRNSKDKKVLPTRIKENLKKHNINVSVGVCNLSKYCLKKVDSRMYKDKRRKK